MVKRLFHIVARLGFSAAVIVFTYFMPLIACLHLMLFFHVIVESVEYVGRKAMGLQPRDPHEKPFQAARYLASHVRDVVKWIFMVEAK